MVLIVKYSDAIFRNIHGSVAVTAHCRCTGLVREAPIEQNKNICRLNLALFHVSKKKGKFGDFNFDTGVGWRSHGNIFCVSVELLPKYADHLVVPLHFVTLEDSTRR